MYELLEKLETLIDKWKNKPYTGDYTQAVYHLCAKELKEILGEPDYYRVRVRIEKGQPNPVVDSVESEEKLPF